MTVTDLPVEPVAPSTGTSAPEPGKKFSLLEIIGPGVVTGASDDDPSGIGTYSQAGAQLGFSVSWTMVLTFPLMVAIQEISARVGRTTGKGDRHQYPRPLSGMAPSGTRRHALWGQRHQYWSRSRCDGRRPKAPDWWSGPPLCGALRDRLCPGADLSRLQAVRPRLEVVVPLPMWGLSRWSTCPGGKH
jgi:hypothetical protein